MEKSLKDNEVWELNTLPLEKKVVGSKWVYKVKTSSDGSIERYKARLIPEGLTSDCNKTFSPVKRRSH